VVASELQRDLQVGKALEYEDPATDSTMIVVIQRVGQQSMTNETTVVEI